MDIDPILLDLEIIKQLNENDKLAVCQEKGTTKFYVDYYSYILPIKRWYNGYNRNDTIFYLEKLLDNIEKSSNIIITGNHFDLANLLKESIFNSFNGLVNFKKTYQNDSFIHGKIILIENKLKTIYNILNTFSCNNLEPLEVINELEDPNINQ